MFKDEQISVSLGLRVTRAKLAWEIVHYCKETLKWNPQGNAIANCKGNRLF